MWSATNIYIRTFAVSFNVNDMEQTVSCDLFLYADNSCLPY